MSAEPSLPVPPERPPSPETSSAEASAAPRTAALQAAGARAWSDHRVRVVVLVVAVAAGAAAVAAALGGERPSEEALAVQAAAEQTAWRNYLRYAPPRLEGGFATGALAVGDGLSPDGLLEDYYAFEAPDSNAFSVIVTAADFAPDLVVTTPEGRRVAASALWQTDQRAEVPGLRGPGRYVIAVTARTPGVGGAYELSAGPPPRPRPLEPGDATSATLGGRGPLRAGRYEDSYALLAEPGTPLLVAVRAAGFRPRLAVLGPEGQVVEPWSTLARIDTDTLHTAWLRYRPGWDEPYLLLVSSEEGGARGDYTVAVETVKTRFVPTDGSGVRGTLGDGGWYRDGRYVDTYQFDADDGTSVLVELRASEFTPEVVLRQGDREVGRRSGGDVVRLDRELDGGRYEVEVTSADPGGTGDYTLVVAVDAPEGPRSQTFSAEARRVGTTARGHTFEVTVRRVRVAPAGDGRVRVHLRIEERSLDFDGEWDEWRRRVGRTRLSDDTGRRYRPVDASGGQDDDDVGPGEAREGEIVYEAPRAGPRPETLTLLYPIGVDGRVVVAVPVDLER